jgi:flagellin
MNWNGVNVSNDGQIKFTSIAYDGNGYLAIGNDGMGGKTVIYNSSDGENWDFIKELSNKGSLGTSKITWDGNEFIAADNNGFSIGIPQYDNSTNEDKNSSNRNFNMTLQVAANSDNQMKITLCDVRASTIGISDLDISSRNGAENSIVDIDKAIQLVSSHRSRMGAYENALEHTLNNVQNYGSNITASESRIRDIDMAKEMMELSKNNILSQAAQSIISQVNKQPYDVLQILRSQ